MGLFDFLIGKKKVATPTEKLEKRAEEVIKNPATNKKIGNDLWVEAMNTSDMKKKEQLLLGSEKLVGNVEDLHFTYLCLYEMYYKQRDEKPSALEMCIEYCKKDIELYPRFIKKYMETSSVIPKVPAFQQLAIIYEKQGKYKDAIKVSELAIQYDQKEDTKSGYEGRIERLKNKIQKANTQ